MAATKMLTSKILRFPETEKRAADCSNRVP